MGKTQGEGGNSLEDGQRWISFGGQVNSTEKPIDLPGWKTHGQHIFVILIKIPGRGLLVFDLL